MSTSRSPIFWHRDLPPLDAEVVDEHVVEAVSDRVAGMIERHGELWDPCYASLMARASKHGSNKRWRGLAATTRT